MEEETKEDEWLLSSSLKYLMFLSFNPLLFLLFFFRSTHLDSSYNKCIHEQNNTFQYLDDLFGVYVITTSMQDWSLVKFKEIVCPWFPLSVSYIHFCKILSNLPFMEIFCQKSILSPFVNRSKA